MAKEFKVLVFKGDLARLMEGQFPRPMKVEDKYEWVDCSIPKLLAPKTEMETLMNIYPELDFGHVELAVMELTEQEISCPRCMDGTTQRELDANGGGYCSECKEDDEV